MPELPDIESYVHALLPRLLGQEPCGLRLAGPFLVRTVHPSPGSVIGRRVSDVRRLGKQIVIEFDDEDAQGPLYFVIHLRVAGRLQWKKPGAAIPRGGQAALDFPCGSLLVTEAGSKRRASLHVVAGREALREFDTGGLEVLSSTPEEFALALRRGDHTLKRALTDPHIISGVGNAYSDEILHRAGLSPFKRTGTLDDEVIERLHRATVEVLTEWVERLREEMGDGFPAKVTAFRPEMNVHGRFGRPCPRCGCRVERVRFAENECDYCPRCQTGGRVLADRALSRLLKEDWPPPNSSD